MKTIEGVDILIKKSSNKKPLMKARKLCFELYGSDFTDKQWNYVYGLVLGYPECCVRAFSFFPQNADFNNKTHNWIPCKKCSQNGIYKEH